jgi:dCMP deaminase
VKEVLVTQEKNEKFVPWKRLGWDEFFMRIAITATGRVACNFHRIASVYADSENKIVSIGYNGPSGGDYHCNEVGCAKVHGDPVTGEIRRCRGVHSEINGIINSSDPRRLKDSTLYITQFPCYDCMKVLNNIGVKRIVYLHSYNRILDGSKDAKDRVPEPEAIELAHKRGIILEQFKFKEDANFQFPDEKKKVDETNGVKEDLEKSGPRIKQKQLLADEIKEKRF